MPAGSYVKRMPWGRQKPPVGFGIDWSHPLAQGLLFAPLLNEMSGVPGDVVTKKLATPDGGKWGVDGYSFNGATDRLDWDSFADLSLTPLTVVVSVNIDALPGNGLDARMLSLCRADNAGSALNCYINNTGILYFSRQTSGMPKHIISQFAKSTNKLTQFAFVDNDTTLTASSMMMYENNLRMSVTPTNGSGTFQPTTGKWCIGGLYYLDTRCLDGTVHYVYVYNRAISADGIAQLYAKPYCFIEGWNYGRSYSIPSSAFINSSFWYQNPILEAI